MTAPDNTPAENRSSSPHPAENRPALRVVDSSELFAGSKAVHIRHDGEYYRLLVTRNGKLILQK
jgi:hemin uptake protein HemP